MGRNVTTPPVGAKSIILTTSQTWAKPADMVGAVLIECIGGGGSGAFSYRASMRPSGGLPGEVSRRLVSGSDIPSSVAVTIGAGAASVSTNTFDQYAAGNAGGETSFGSILKAKGGLGGASDSSAVYLFYGGGAPQYVGYNSGANASYSVLIGATSADGLRYGSDSPPSANYFGGPTAGGGPNIGAANVYGRPPSVGYGSGGVGAYNANGGAGAAPGGGGGGAYQTAANSYQSGAGARGEIRIWYW